MLREIDCVFTNTTMYTTGRIVLDLVRFSDFLFYWFAPEFDTHNSIV